MLVTFTATPLGAAESLYLRGALVDGAGINYVSNYLRQFAIGGAATTTGYDYEAAFTARFGTPQVGQYVHIWAQVMNRSNGQLSGFLRTSAIVVTT
jgi:hypothetical protein